MQDIIERFGKSPLCNNRPDRALHIGDFVFPLCYRCMMIAVGIIIGIILLYLLIDKGIIKWKINYFIYGIALSIPTILDGVLQTFTNYESINIIRITTGLLCGLGLSVIIISFTEFLKHKIKFLN